MKGLFILLICFASVLGAALQYRGVNQAGAEFASSKLPGRENYDYVWPKESSINYFLSKGFNTFRIPFRWERMEPVLGDDFDETYFKGLNRTVNSITKGGGYSLLDPHNYIRYRGKVIGSDPSVTKEQFKAFWQKLAGIFKDNSKVMFNVMNEPHGTSTLNVLNVMQAGIDGIRASGAKQLILVPGNGYSGAHSWGSTFYGQSNAVVMGNITDPLNNFGYDMHQYFDKDSSGTNTTCVTNWSASKINGATKWLRSRGRKGFIGEFGFTNGDQNCYKAGHALLTHLQNNTDVWIGYTYWAAGPFWGNKYAFNAEPINGTADRGVVADVLLRYATENVDTSPLPVIIESGDEEESTDEESEGATDTSQGAGSSAGSAGQVASTGSLLSYGWIQTVSFFLFALALRRV